MIQKPLIRALTEDLPPFHKKPETLKVFDILRGEENRKKYGVPCNAFNVDVTLPNPWHEYTLFTCSKGNFTHSIVAVLSSTKF